MFAAKGSPAYLYRFCYVQMSMREQLRTGTPHGGEIAYVFGTLSAGRGGAPTPEDFAVSLYTKMGIDPVKHQHTNTGRPVQLVNGGQPIKELFA